MLPIIAKQKRLVEQELPLALKFTERVVDTFASFDERHNEKYAWPDQKVERVRKLIAILTEQRYTILKDDMENALNLLRRYCSGEKDGYTVKREFAHYYYTFYVLKEELEKCIEREKDEKASFKSYEKMTR